MYGKSSDCSFSSITHSSKSSNEQCSNGISFVHFDLFVRVDRAYGITPFTSINPIENPSNTVFEDSNAPALAK